MAYTRFSNLELIDMPNCIALSYNGGCARLIVSSCLGKNCPFKQTREDCESSVSKVMNRLAKLDDEKQSRVARKYYGGKRIWLENV